VTGDFALPEYQIDPAEWEDGACYSNASTSWRLGQVPQFLDLDQDELQDEDVVIKLSHHAQFFSNYTGTSFNRLVGELLALYMLTTMNSFAIESQIANIKGLSNHIIYLNDDYFFSDSLKPFDFYTPRRLDSLIMLNHSHHHLQLSVTSYAFNPTFSSPLQARKANLLTESGSV